MATSRIIRWGGAAAIGTALLGIVETMLLLRYGDSPGPRAALYAYEITWGTKAAMLAVYALAIRQLHLEYGRGFGRLGKIAVFLIVLSGVLFTIKTLIVLGSMVTGANVPFFIMPFFMLPGIVGQLIGPVLLGIAILRAGVMPRWFGWLQTLSVPLIFATGFLAESYGGPYGEVYGAFAGALIMIILGYALLAGRTVRRGTQVPSAA